MPETSDLDRNSGEAMLRSDAEVWRSETPVEPDWPLPVAAPPHRGRRWLWSAPVVAVIVLTALVFAFGGFEHRDDALHTVPIGATMSTGRFDFTFSRATAQRQHDQSTYKVVVYGTARNTTDTGAAPSSDQFVGRDSVDPEVEVADGTQIGADGNYLIGSSLNPGLPPVPFQVEFSFDDDWEPSPTFRFAAAELVDEQYFLNEEQSNWQVNSKSLFQTYLPLKRLPNTG